MSPFRCEQSVYPVAHMYALSRLFAEGEISGAIRLITNYLIALFLLQRFFMGPSEVHYYYD